MDKDMRGTEIDNEGAAEEKLAGECPICEGDLVAKPKDKTVKCKECG